MIRIGYFIDTTITTNRLFSSVYHLGFDDFMIRVLRVAPLCEPDLSVFDRTDWRWESRRRSPEDAVVRWKALEDAKLSPSPIIGGELVRSTFCAECWRKLQEFRDPITRMGELV